MGASASTQSSGLHPPTKGLHVLRVTPSSPASETDIEPFFDFIVGIDSVDAKIDSQAIDASSLERIVEAHEGETLSLAIWSSKSRSTRTVSLVPSRSWSQKSPTTARNQAQKAQQPSLLGLSLRVCDPTAALDNVWHILEILEGSPAESAGLVPFGDWIVGWSGGALGNENAFYDLVEAHVDKPLRVYVYSADFNTLREVVLVPNRHWGGDGLLGCGVGFGLLHRIPAPADLPSAEELLRELQLDDETHDLFVPADYHGNGYGAPASAGFGLSTFEHSGYFNGTEPHHEHHHDHVHSHVGNGHTHEGNGHLHDHDDYDHSHDGDHHDHSHDSDDNDHDHDHLQPDSSSMSNPDQSPVVSPEITNVVAPSQNSFATTSILAPRALLPGGLDIGRPRTPGNTPGRIGTPQSNNATPVPRGRAGSGTLRPTGEEDGEGSGPDGSVASVD